MGLEAGRLPGTSKHSPCCCAWPFLWLVASCFWGAHVQTGIIATAQEAGQHQAEVGVALLLLLQLLCCPLSGDKSLRA